MKDRDIRVEYTDKNGKEVILSQGRSGGIMVAERAEKDIAMPLGKVVKKGEFHMVFHAMGSEKSTHYDEAGLVEWYETKYQELKSILEKRFDKIYNDEESENASEETEEEHSCKHCENFDMHDNLCLVKNEKGYLKQNCLHPNCEQFREGTWGY